MKLILASILALSFTSAFAGESTTRKDKVNYGTRSDGVVVPTSKETKTTTTKESPQAEEDMNDEGETVKTKEVKRTKTKTY